MTNFIAALRIARSPFILAALFSVSVSFIGTTADAQTFSSGSDGSDGPLTIAPNQGTIVFDPADTARWGRALDPDGDGVYNFTTITINAGSTLRLQGDKVNRPVYWLASGTVVIAGTIDLSGVSLSGCCTSDLAGRRQIASGGSGGYAGGAGGITNSLPATPGDGPGGGAGGLSPCNVSQGNLVPSLCGRPGVFSGNRYLIPLVGGSGGEGATANFYVNGGGGGGAILIASSASINLDGTIRADGGGSGWGNVSGGERAAGGGSGGAIRLVASTIAGSGHLSVNGGTSSNAASRGSAGWVRLEGFTISNSLQFDSGTSVLTRGSPIDPGSLKPASSIRVTAIDGIPVPANSLGAFVLPDVSISKSTPVNVDIQATGIPPGTVVTLQVYPQTPTDLTTVNLPPTQATLSGTLQASTATATFTFPYGFSRGFVRATWTQ